MDECSDSSKIGTYQHASPRREAGRPYPPPSYDSPVKDLHPFSVFVSFAPDVILKTLTRESK